MSGSLHRPVREMPRSAQGWTVFFKISASKQLHSRENFFTIQSGGWGLLEFLQAEDDDLTRLEISERVKDKLRRRKEIRAETITVTILFEDDILKILTRFLLIDSKETQNIDVGLDRVKVEVILID